MFQAVTENKDGFSGALNQTEQNEWKTAAAEWYICFHTYVNLHKILSVICVYKKVDRKVVNVYWQLLLQIYMGNY